MMSLLPTASANKGERHFKKQRTKFLSAKFSKKSLTHTFDQIFVSLSVQAISY